MSNGIPEIKQSGFIPYSIYKTGEFIWMNVLLSKLPSSIIIGFVQVVLYLSTEIMQNIYFKYWLSSHMITLNQVLILMKIYRILWDSDSNFTFSILYLMILLTTLEILSILVYIFKLNSLILYTTIIPKKEIWLSTTVFHYVMLLLYL